MGLVDMHLPPRVTVMLPVRNEQRYIRQTLAQLYAQDYPHERLEVVIADGLSTDKTREVIADFADQHRDLSITVVQNSRRWSSAGRNIAISKGRGDFFLLMDGHVHFSRASLVRDMVDAANREGADVLGRPQPLTPPDIDEFQRHVAIARSSRIAHSLESYIYSEYQGWTSPISIGVMYRSSIFSRVGLFDESFDAAEDLEFNYRLERLGYRCYTSPQFTVKYYPRDSYRGVIRQMYRYGKGRAFFVLKHPERFTVETIIPAGFALAVLVLPLGGMLLWNELFWLWGLTLVSYGLLVGGVSVALAVKHTRIMVSRLMAIFVCVHFALGVGFIRGVFQRICSVLSRKSNLKIDWVRK